MQSSHDTVDLAPGRTPRAVPAPGPPPYDAAGTNPPVRPGPRREVVVGGPSATRFAPKAGFLLSRATDEVVSQFGTRVYELMLYDPAVACAFALWKAGVISDGLQLTPAVRVLPGEVVSKRKQKTELKLAEEVTRAAERSFLGLEDPIDQTLEEMLDAFAFGASLAEVTFKWEDAGPDRGRQVFKSVVPKPRANWAFRVDPFMAVRSVRCWTLDGWADVAREKFAVLSWKPKHRDPRGRSGFRAAYNPWNMKVQHYPEFGEYLHHFAQPGIAATAGVESQGHAYLDPVTGKTKFDDPLDGLAQALEEYKSRSYLALPYGSQVTLIQSQGDGKAYHDGFDRFDLEIFRAILFSGRPMQESKYGSKADTESGTDLVSMSFQAGRKPLGRMVERDVLYPFVALNWGREVAHRLTPRAGFGGTNPVTADLLSAMSAAYNAGFIDEAHLPVLWERLGLPPVSAEAWDARQARKTTASDPAAGQNQKKSEDARGGKSNGTTQGKPKPNVTPTNPVKRPQRAA